MSSRSTNQKPASERIQKVLANSGLGSRRQIEAWIVAGRIVIDGQPAKLGDRLSGDERIRFDGKPINLGRVATADSHSYIAYYKPAGEVTTRRDPEGRKNAFDSLPKPPTGRWINVGRLDVSTSGLIVFLTDGELAHRLMHPSFEVPRRYAVRLLGTLTNAQIQTLKNGVELDDGVASFEQITRSGGSGVNRWYHVQLREGRNREVRRLFEAVELQVSRLIRISYGPIELGKMHRGSHRPLLKKEIDALYAAVKLARPKAGAH